MMHPIRHIAIIGGTHGNETNGVFVVDAYQRQGGTDLQRPSFTDVRLVIGNPAAVQKVVRFVDEDLNRQFSVHALREATVEAATYEAARAKALNASLGPKPGTMLRSGAPLPSPEEERNPAVARAVDFIIDLHTTTSNMGCCFMVSEGLPIYLASYARAWMESKGMPVNIVVSPASPTNALKSGVGSIALHSVVIECGPTPWGLIRYDVVAWMREGINRILDGIDFLNRRLALPMPSRSLWGSSWARGIGSDCFPTVVLVHRLLINLEARDLARIAVPIDETTGRACMMYAKDFQDSDFKPLRKGDPIFEDVDGNTFFYDGRFGHVVYPLFVNEAAYNFASSGIGFVCSKQEEVPLAMPTLSSSKL